MIVDGIVRLSKDEQSKKHDLFNECKVDGILISFNEVQSSKQWAPRYVNWDGNFIVCKFTQLEKTAFPIYSTVCGIEIFFNAEHPQNDLSSIQVNVSGRVIAVNDVHPLKHNVGRWVIVIGRVISRKYTHWEKLPSFNFLKWGGKVNDLIEHPHNPFFSIQETVDGISRLVYLVFKKQSSPITVTHSGILFFHFFWSSFV